LEEIVAPRRRYQPLVDFLADSDAGAVVLTYKEIAAMIGGALPESAILQAGWWTKRSQFPIEAWTALGWRAHVDRDQLRVRFTREAEGER